MFTKVKLSIAALLLTSINIQSTELSYYGTPYQANSLNNLKIGYKWDVAFSFRIKAKYSGPITSVRWFNKNNASSDANGDPKPGYYEGDGGQLKVYIFEDINGSPNLSNGPLTETVTLQGESLMGPSSLDCRKPGKGHACNVFPKVDFNNGGFTAEKGKHYHIVFANLDDNNPKCSDTSLKPVCNFVSVNVLKTDNAQTQTVNDELILAGVNFHTEQGTINPNVVWKNATSDRRQPSWGNTPIYELTYGGTELGKYQGTPITEVYANNTVKLYTTSDKNNIQKVRQTFVYKGSESKQYNQLVARLRKSGTPGQLKMRLLDKSGVELTYAYLPRSLEPSSEYTWVSLNFSSSLVLHNNENYTIELAVVCGGNASCAPTVDSYFEIIPYQDGTHYKFSDTLTDYSDGEVQIITYGEDENGKRELKTLGWETYLDKSFLTIPVYLK